MNYKLSQIDDNNLMAGPKKTQLDSNSNVDQTQQNPKKHDEAMEMQKEQAECEDRFHLVQKLGEGTYGVVYQAFDDKLQTVSTLTRYRDKKQVF